MVANGKKKNIIGNGIWLTIKPSDLKFGRKKKNMVIPPQNRYRYYTPFPHLPKQHRVGYH